MSGWETSRLICDLRHSRFCSRATYHKLHLPTSRLPALSNGFSLCVGEASGKLREWGEQTTSARRCTRCWTWGCAGLCGGCLRRGGRGADTGRGGELLLERLTKKIPLLWEEQRERFVFGLPRLVGTRTRATSL